jgi:TetR/AcrR family transcriptional regulator, hemagglutinin/protease regulatory protein
VSASMTPTRPRANRMPPEKRRAQLLDCAVTLFAELGIGRTVHSDVALAAGVSVPTVFFYFESSDALKEAVVVEVARFLEEIVAAAEQEPGAGIEKLLSILRAFAGAVDSRPDYIKVWLDWSTVIAEPTWSKYEKFQDHILHALETLIERGKRDGAVEETLNSTIGAHIIMGSGHMIAQMKFRNCDEALVDEFIDTIVHRTLSANALPT